MKLIGSTKSKITKDENSENVNETTTVPNMGAVAASNNKKNIII